MTKGYFDDNIELLKSAIQYLTAEGGDPACL